MSKRKIQLAGTRNNWARILILCTLFLTASRPAPICCSDLGNWLGVSFRLVLSEGGVFPVSVASVKPGSAAEKAGFKPGDIIYSINSISVSPTNFFSVLSSFPPGHLATFHVLREKKMWPVQLILPNHGGTPPEKIQVTPGPGKSDPSIEPVTIVKRVEPLYPEQAKKQKIQGKVDLEMLVDEQGNISELKVLKSPHPIISQAALTTVKFWEFTPAKKDGVPFATKLIITIHFRLK